MRGRRTRRDHAASLVVALALTLAVVAPSPARAATVDDPNVLLIVTDDQRWDSLWAMPNLQTSLVARGVTFSNAVVPTPLCCPSRAAILTGTYAHTNDVWRNAPPHGGFESFDDRRTIATLLHRAGYRTGLFGKYLNRYRTTDGAYVAPGWDRWVVFRSSGFYDYDLSVDGDLDRYGSAPGDYSTTVLADELRSFIGEGARPFFAVYAPYAPHQPATPAPGDEGAFSDVPLPASPAFDEADVSDKPAFIRALPRLSAAAVNALTDRHRDALRSLLAVDRAIGDVIALLRARGELDETLIVFTSDNGLLFGEHRWRTKRVAYEASIRVPLVIRFDPLAVPGATNDALVANVDIAPTIATLAGVSTRSMDGVPLVRALHDPSFAPDRKGVPLEYLAKRNDKIPTYCGYRTARHTYVRYATGEEELYDLRRDPHQLRNIAATAAATPVVDRLRTRSMAVCDPPDDAFSWER
jgi:N-acetylglucosamine-6-sulfatase